MKSTIKSMKINMVMNTIKGIMGILFPLITFPYVSRVLGVDNIGKYNFANSIISYFTLLAGLGISTYAIREGAKLRNKNEFVKFSNEIFTINTISTIASYLLIIIFIFLIPEFGNYKILLLILSLQVLFKFIGVEWIYSIFEDYTYITIRSIIFQIISLILMFAFVKERADINKYALITVVSAVGSNILNYFHVKKYCKVKLIRAIDWRIHMKPIMILFAMSVTVTIYVSSDITILGFISGDRSVGLYSVSAKVYSILKTVLSSILIVSIPRLSAFWGNNKKEEFENTATEIYKILITLVFPIVTLVVILKEEIILIISGSTYLEATTSMVLLSVTLIFCLGAWFWGQCILVPLKKEWIVFKATILSAIVNLGLNFVLIPILDVNGAALTTLIAEGIAFIWCAYEGKKYVKLQGIKNIILKSLIGCSAIVITAILLKNININIFIFCCIITLASCIIYFFVEYLLKNEVVIDSLNIKIKKFKKSK